MEDLELVTSAKANNQDAYTELYNRYLPKIKKSISLMSPNIAIDAKEDLAADITTKVLIKLPMFKGDSLFSTWVYAITRNEVNMYFRNKRFKPLDNSESLIILSDDHEDTERQVDIPVEDTGFKHFEVMKDLQPILDKLTPKLGKALQVKMLGGLSFIETAAELGISVPAAKSRVHRGLEEAQHVMEGIKNSRVQPVFSLKKCVCCDTMFTPTGCRQLYAPGHAPSKVQYRKSRMVAIKPLLKVKKDLPEMPGKAIDKDMVTITIPVGALDRIWNSRTPAEKAKVAEMLLSQFI